MANSKHIIPRLLTCPDYSFFLFGPRGTGKTTWLNDVLGNSLRLDLLDSSLHLELMKEPHRLEAMIAHLKSDEWVVLDEIQKNPVLLDEVHRIMESRGLKFALCGSSARKLKRGGANLLAGRALTLNMEGFSAHELGSGFNLNMALNWGMLPMVLNNPQLAPDILAAYVDTYLQEEIRAEGLIRHEPPFLRFMSIAGQMNAQMINTQGLARDSGVPRSTVDGYFSILVDTLLGNFLQAWRPGFKVRETARPKFFWFDPGVARAAAGWLRDPVDRAWQGTALETIIFHELRVFNQVSRKHRPIYFYRTPSGVEVDFIVETARKRSGSPGRVVALEVKLSDAWRREWEAPMRSLKSQNKIDVEKMIAVYTGQRVYRFDGLHVLPVEQFITALHQGDIF
ncbi:ATP-binding protein [Desulfonatronovibrio magnus]|uniref:ATP-binding protein n=1 Tax=Desulfonatronovibrio magnus TaxID=698827 RepID=UPI0005EADE89|nr:AAA family ATPase [Desulfonatronovibrio magnus]